MKKARDDPARCCLTKEHLTRCSEPMSDNTQTEPPDLSPLSSLCSSCRTGPFSFENFRQAIQEDYEESTTSTGHSYMTTWTQISQTIQDGSCAWCTIIQRTRDGLPTDRFPSVNENNVEVKFRILKKMGWNRSDSDFCYLQICLNGFKEATYLAYEGRCFLFKR